LDLAYIEQLPIDELNFLAEAKIRQLKKKAEEREKQLNQMNSNKGK